MQVSSIARTAEIRQIVVMMATSRSQTVTFESHSSCNWPAVISRSGVLSGRVLDETGHAARGVWVSAQPEIDPASPPPINIMSGAARRVTTGGDGRFAIDRLAPNARFRLRAWRVAGGETELEARAPQRELVLQLARR